MHFLFFCLTIGYCTALVDEGVVGARVVVVVVVVVVAYSSARGHTYSLFGVTLEGGGGAKRRRERKDHRTFSRTLFDTRRV